MRSDLTTLNLSPGKFHDKPKNNRLRLKTYSFRFPKTVVLLVLAILSSRSILLAQSQTLYLPVLQATLDRLVRCRLLEDLSPEWLAERITRRDLVTLSIGRLFALPLRLLGGLSA